MLERGREGAGRAEMVKMRERKAKRWWRCMVLVE
jgi:hypothetical protein